MRIVASSLAVSLALALAACGGTEDEGETATLVGADAEEATSDAPVAEAAEAGAATDAAGGKPAADTGKPAAADAGAIDFGDDASTWSNDNECDDPRFQGPGMTATPLLDEDIGHDATDCREAFERGELTLR